MPDRAISLEGQPGLDPETAFGSHYFRHGCGVPYERNEHWLGFFAGVADGIVRDLHPSSVLDASGIDVSEHAISEADESVRDAVRVGSLSEPLERRYDLVVCIEVLEHVPAPEADAAIANLCAASDRLLISTTPDDFREPSHVNVRPPEAWSAALAREGFFRDLDRDFPYITPWAALYTKLEEPPSETVRRYDRSWWRLRREVSEVRASLLEAQDRLAALEGAGEAPGLEELRDQLAASEEEVLRLRDLLIGKDAELGVTKGQLTALEGHAHLLLSTATRIQARVPGAMRLAGAGLRRLQGRQGRKGA